MTDATHYTLQIFGDTDDRDGSSWGYEDSETDVNGDLLVCGDIDGAVGMARFILGADGDDAVREPREGWLPVIGILAHDHDPDMCETPDDPQSWGEGYVTLDGVYHNDLPVEDSADVWNEMSAFCAADRPDASEWLARRGSVIAYGETLARLVRADYSADPEAFGGTRSWEDLHGVCDANDFLQLADEEHGRDYPDTEGMTIPEMDAAMDEYNGFVNAAVAYAEGVLFNGGARKRLGA